MANTDAAGAGGTDKPGETSFRASFRARNAARIKRRGAAVRAMPEVRLEPRHTERCRVLPDRNALLDRMPRGGVAAEIGVAFGDFSAEILTRMAPARLHLVDPWAGERYGGGFDRVAARFAAEIGTGQVEMHRGISTEMLPGFPEASLDFAYIDTDHSYRTTRDELRLCAPLIRPGGRIAGHDFCTGNVVQPVVYGVVQAVTEFCAGHDWGFEYLTLESNGHASFCIVRL